MNGKCDDLKVRMNFSLEEKQDDIASAEETGAGITCAGSGSAEDRSTEMRYTEPGSIEERSMEIINAELKKRGIAPRKGYDHIVRRVIHATADFDYAENLEFSQGLCNRFGEIFSPGTLMVTDTNMALSGINERALTVLGLEKKCFMSDPEIIEKARAKKVTRAYLSAEKAAGLGREIVYVSGNAPTFLTSIRELWDKKQVSPKLVIACPVGFVNVIESKSLIRSAGFPYIIAGGNKGGSGVAASIVNAVMYRLMEEKG